MYGGFSAGVVVYSIDPDYYASGSFAARFEVEASGVEYLPVGAIGVMSNNNDNPEMYAGTAHASQDCEILSIQGSRVVFGQDSSHNHSTKSYLGCIVSADRSQILWTNNSKPLP